MEEARVSLRYTTSKIFFAETTSSIHGVRSYRDTLLDNHKSGIMTSKKPHKVENAFTYSK